MNKKISILVLEREISKINYFDLNFKNKVLNYKVVKNMNDFYNTLMPRPWTFVFIEHDLIAGENVPSNNIESGYNALVVINENYPYKADINTIIVHTSNSAAAKNMMNYTYLNNMNNVVYNAFNSSEFKATIVKINKFIADSQQY